METNFSDSAAAPNDSSNKKISTSVQDHIRALNRQMKIDGDVTPSRTDGPLSPLPTGASPKPKSLSRLQMSPSSPSKTAQLLKAANVIRKSFDPETEILSRPQGVGGAQLNSPKAGQPPRRNERQSSEMQSPTDIFCSIHTDTITEGGNEEDVEDDDLGASNSVTSQSILDPDIASRKSRRSITSEESNAPRPIAAGRFNEAELTPFAIDADDPKDQHTLGKPLGMRSRRSHLRSPRVLLTSPDADSIDGAQSVTSIQSASSYKTSQVPTLSSRALRFLKDKKDRQKASTTNSIVSESNPISESIGGVSEQVVNENIPHPARALVGAALKSDSNFNETGTGETMVCRPQTIHLSPAVPKTDSISDLNRDISDQQQYQTRSLSHDDHQGELASDDLVHIISVTGSSENVRKEKDMMYQKTASTDESNHQSKSASDVFLNIITTTRSRENLRKRHNPMYQKTASVDESNYSEVKAKHLFGVHQEISPVSQSDNAPESDYDAFIPGGGSPFDSACHALNMMNPRPLIKSALNAIYLGNDAFQNAIFCNTPRNVSGDDAPWDEDENVCIEVEHDVVQLMEQRSHAETDSYYSGPIRSGSLRSESTQDHPGT